jgi:2-polyprenyl-6-methoxyphenol hydroxylase-like FAD-dependent oxidoreductase
MPRERRWIIVAADGRHSTLGRSAPPDEVEVAKAASALAAVGLSGWLVRLEGDYWSRRTPVVLAPLRPLAHAAAADWPAATTAFEALRTAATLSALPAQPSRVGGKP